MTLSINLNDIQKSVLGILLDKYNGSKTFKGDNKVQQSFYIKPEDVFPIYNDDFADTVQITAFENDIDELEKVSLIRTEKCGRVITRIYAVLENISQYHKLIGTEDKRDALKKSEMILHRFMGRNDVLNKICRAQLNRVSDFKLPNIAQDYEKLEQILKCLDFILQNKEEILERELSIELYGDSKLFEKELKIKVCSLLEEYCPKMSNEFSTDEKSLKREKLLSNFMIVKNPTYFYFKGNGQIIFEDGTKTDISYRRPIALRSDSIKDISVITISCCSIMTVENLTSFNRVNSEDTFYLFLSGYNNSCKTEFLKKMYNDNQQKNWLHFGDIDPDGFLILNNLRIKTGIDFKPYLMEIDKLTQYKKYCKPLEPNDCVKAKSMVENHLFSDIAQFMLNNNCKLEQEIISWKNK